MAEEEEGSEAAEAEREEPLGGKGESYDFDYDSNFSDLD